VRERERREVLGAEVVHDTEVVAGLCGFGQREHRAYSVSNPDSEEECWG